MGALLKKILDIVLAGSFKRVLLGAGLSLGSSAILLKIFNYYIAKLTSHLSNYGAVGDFALGALSLMGIAKVDVALNLIIGAFIIKFTFKKTQLFLTKGK